MGIYLRTSRSTGISFPWVLAIFVLPIAATYWLLLLCFYILKFAVIFSVQFYVVLGKAIFRAREQQHKAE